MGNRIIVDLSRPKGNPNRIRVVPLTPEEERERLDRGVAEDSRKVVRAEIDEMRALRVALLDAVAGGDPPVPQNRNRFKVLRTKYPEVAV